MTPLDKYKSDLDKKSFRFDPAQEKAVIHTQRLYDDLSSTASSPGILKRLLKQPVDPVKGIYLWGDVGRGKTYIMDSFYECLPFTNKKRMHFNHFMKHVHDCLKSLPKSPDPLKIVGKQFAADTRILCLDEFHVDDITDAMILGGLLEALFNNGVCLATTSNIDPEKLYLNGLQRERFLPAIALLIKHTEVVELNGLKDYRMELLEQHGTFHLTPLEESDKIIQNELEDIAPETIQNNIELRLNNRNIKVKGLAGDVIWLDFDQICNTPRSSSDYIELASNYHTVMISQICSMSDGQNDVAQRFIQLIDALYDHSVKLILASACPAEAIYTGKALNFSFQRTLSRLHEMRSSRYLALAHRG